MDWRRKMCKSRYLLTMVCCMSALIGECGVEAASEPSRISVRAAGIGLAVASDGSYAVTATKPAWQFSGSVGSRISDIASRSGRDRAGTYGELVFTYAAPGRGAPLGAIRASDD